MVIECICENDMTELKNALNRLGPEFSIVSIYGMNGRHFAWVKKQTTVVIAHEGATKKKKKGLSDGSA